MERSHIKMGVDNSGLDVCLLFDKDKTQFKKDISEITENSLKSHPDYSEKSSDATNNADKLTDLLTQQLVNITKIEHKKKTTGKQIGGTECNDYSRVAAQAIIIASAVLIVTCVYEIVKMIKTAIFDNKKNVRDRQANKAFNQVIDDITTPEEDKNNSKDLLYWQAERQLSEQTQIPQTYIHRARTFFTNTVNYRVYIVNIALSGKPINERYDAIEKHIRNDLSDDKLEEALKQMEAFKKEEIDKELSDEQFKHDKSSSIMDSIYTIGNRLTTYCSSTMMAIGGYLLSQEGVEKILTYLWEILENIFNSISTENLNYLITSSYDKLMEGFIQYSSNPKVTNIWSVILGPLEDFICIGMVELLAVGATAVVSAMGGKIKQYIKRSNKFKKKKRKNTKKTKMIKKTYKLKNINKKKKRKKTKKMKRN